MGDVAKLLVQRAVLLIDRRQFSAGIVVRSLTAGLGKEENVSPVGVLRAREHSLHEADLLDDLAVEILFLHLAGLTLDTSHDGEQQVHQYDRIEDDTDEEEEHLCV